MPEAPPEIAESAFDRNVAAILACVLAIAGLVEHAMLAGGFAAALPAFAGGGGGEPPLLSKILYSGAIVAGVWLRMRRLAGGRGDRRAVTTTLALGAIGLAFALGGWPAAAAAAAMVAVVAGLYAA